VTRDGLVLSQDSAAPSTMERVSIFWDFGQSLILTLAPEKLTLCTENCRGFSGTTGQDVVKNIRHAAHSYGQITLFKAYADAPSTKQSVRSDLQVAGVSLVDCPHNGKKEVADKMMIGMHICNTFVFCVAMEKSS
jgi:hypothetical protein